MTGNRTPGTNLGRVSVRRPKDAGKGARSKCYAGRMADMAVDTLAEPAKPASTLGGNSVSFDDAMTKYAGQWLLLRVSRADAQGHPTDVHVIAHGPSQDVVCRAMAEVTPQAEPPEHLYYVVEAYPHIRSGEAARRALAERAEQEPALLSARRA